MGALIRDVAHEFNRMFVAVALVYGVIFAYWEIGERAEPGQQYADPLLPVLYCSWLLGCPLYYLFEIGRTLVRRFR
jgi:hypothetical protein